MDRFRNRVGFHLHNSSTFVDIFSVEDKPPLRHRVFDTIRRTSVKRCDGSCGKVKRSVNSYSARIQELAAIVPEERLAKQVDGFWNEERNRCAYSGECGIRNET